MCRSQRRATLTVLATSLVLSLLLVQCATAQEELIEEREGHRVQPRIVPATDERIGRLKAPAGFRVEVFARDLGEPRMLAVGDDGTVYVTRRKPGDVLALRDADGDGRAESVTPVVQNLPDAHGITLRDGKMYIATVRELYVADLGSGAKGKPQKILGDIPPGGRHPNRTLGFGPDGLLYVSVGSTCNCCVEKHSESAAIFRVKPDGSGRELFASGLRNTIGFGWHPKTQQMWGMDHGSDWLGDDFPPEELNRLEAGKHYGWPFFNADNQLIELRDYPAGFDADGWRAKVTPYVIGYTAHTAPLQMAFYTGEQFPAEYRNDAFVAMRGSWNRKPPAGYEVVRIRFDESGKPQKIEPFVTGFLLDDGAAAFARLAGCAVAKDGSLLVGDDTNGVIYRIGYDGKR